MLTIEDLRKSLTEQQCDLLDRVWLYRLQKKEWPPIRVIEHAIDTATIAAKDLAKSLGGSVIYETQESNQHRYALTLLGVLLSPGYGGEAEALLVQYLEYARSRYSRDPETERITSAELVRDLGLAPEISSYMRELVSIGHMWGGSASFGNTGEWSAGVPTNINRLRFEEDLHSYIRRQALDRYSKSEPTEMSERYKSFFESQKLAGVLLDEGAGQQLGPQVDLGFDFVTHSQLREFMSRDWHELQIVRESGAWKSCLVLCGSILEAMLLDVVKQLGDGLRVPGEGSIPKDSNNWRLVHLITLAKANGLLSGPAASFASGLRDYRNLIHLDRQVREMVVADQRASDLAIQVVALIHSELMIRTLL